MEGQGQGRRGEGEREEGGRMEEPREREAGLKDIRRRISLESLHRKSCSWEGGMGKRG